MRSEELAAGRIREAARPGRGSDPMASGHAPQAGVGPGVRANVALVYVTWSGATATVHRRIAFGVASHGIGSEFN